jgi:hypothetical protein
MATRGNDPYEQARVRALIEETDAKKKIDLSVGPVYNFVNNPVIQDPNKFYAPKNLTYYGDEFEDDEFPFEGESPNAPADLTDIPTSTTNVSRPRTVAAGYDSTRRVLTVVFRDGTIWNYDNVTEGEWQNFHASISKGRPWINDKLFGVGYPADMTNLDPRIQADLYKAARTAQLQFQSKRSYRAPQQKKGQPATTKRLGKTATLKAQRSLRARTPKRGGANPSTGGKPQ